MALHKATLDKNNYDLSCFQFLLSYLQHYNIQLDYEIGQHIETGHLQISPNQKLMLDKFLVII